MWNRAYFVHQRLLCNLHSYRSSQHVPPRAMFAMATLLAFQPMTSVSEASARRKTVVGKDECPFYGCPLLPQDIYYDEKVKSALGSIREMKREQVREDTAGSYQILKSSSREDCGTMTLVGYKGGPVDGQINQDRAFCVNPYLKSSKGDESLLMGVFDGHAPLGEDVAQFAVSDLPVTLAKKMKNRPYRAGQKESIDFVRKTLIETFIDVDRRAPAEVSGGCTASVVYKLGSQIFVANAGDSRSFIVVYRASQQTAQIVYISREDKPEIPEERKRVERMGGDVYIPILGVSRVLYRDKKTGVQSGLAMSRSIGDWEAGKLGVIPDPIVHVIDIDDIVESQLQSQEGNVSLEEGENVVDDDVHIFAVSATDGLTDYVTPDTISSIVAGSLFHKDGTHLVTALEQLIYVAAQGWERARQGLYRDDISIAVATLRVPPPIAKQ